VNHSFDRWVETNPNAGTKRQNSRFPEEPAIPSRKRLPNAAGKIPSASRSDLMKRRQWSEPFESFVVVAKQFILLEIAASHLDFAIASRIIRFQRRNGITIPC